MKQSIGNFLLRRLQEAAIRHIFGVPGITAWNSCRQRMRKSRCRHAPPRRPSAMRVNSEVLEEHGRAEL